MQYSLTQIETELKKKITLSLQMVTKTKRFRADSENPSG